MEDSSGTFDASSEKYAKGDYSSFRKDVLTATGAPDFLRPENTTQISPFDAKSGDVILLDQGATGDGIIDHVQLITQVMGSIINGLQGNQVPSTTTDKVLDKLGVIDRSDPTKKSDYVGDFTQAFTWDSANNTYQNQGNAQSPDLNKEIKSDASKTLRPQVRRFNFKNPE